MKEQRFKVIRGVVSELQVRQDEQEFVFNSSDTAAGGVAAVGLALGGLAGAATGAVLSSSDTADKVDFFVCKVGDQLVGGRFGTVSFVNGDVIEVVGEVLHSHVDAYAVTRPRDRTIWMHPHCGRGSHAHIRFSAKWIAILSWVVSPIVMGGFFWAATDPGDAIPPTWFVLLLFGGIGLLASTIFGYVATRFSKFAHLSGEIFAALGFEKPSEVDLHKRLRQASKTFTNPERLNFHPHARWVYKY